jgi:CDP-paratose 2-epimerase
MRHEYIEQNRTGDHICYYSDLRKMRAHYPQWKVTKPLVTVFEEIVEGWVNRSSLASAPCAS